MVVCMPKFNPFRPNSIVTTGMFCGRWDELRSVEQSLFQTKHGNPKHFIVQGERHEGRPVSAAEWTELTAIGIVNSSEEPRPAICGASVILSTQKGDH